MKQRIPNAPELFVLFVILMNMIFPIAYLVSGGYDERWSWRMLSWKHMTRCKAEYESEDACFKPRGSSRIWNKSLKRRPLDEVAIEIALGMCKKNKEAGEPIDSIFITLGCVDMNLNEHSIMNRTRVDCYPEQPPEIRFHPLVHAVLSPAVEIITNILSYV